MRNKKRREEIMRRGAEQSREVRSECADEGRKCLQEARRRKRGEGVEWCGGGGAWKKGVLPAGSQAPPPPPDTLRTQPTSQVATFEQTRASNTRSLLVCLTER
ncbi:hypothetical protein Pcinc_018667 [Petrolisthes cinctipes]|uniref:Uncharacterized protein n=1 Tax=Petrolisthes cinctipes TaxID=88211 RepID=A0AAE1FRM8_PETCI|nr:hypothetical protein Pcinc_018667 [Petrolisthes cinctipes]